MQQNAETKDSLEDRVMQFDTMSLPGQPMMMHMGTSYLIHDLMNEVKRLRHEESSHGARMIAEERQRQMRSEGYTPEFDDQWTHGELYIAAECYACLDDITETPELWPWPPNAWKPKDRVRNLVRAGALLAAEIDRLQRLAHFVDG